MEISYSSLTDNLSDGLFNAISPITLIILNKLLRSLFNTFKL